MAIWAWLALGWIASLVAFAIYVFRSPTGYQDNTGFHLGHPPGYFPPEQIQRLRLVFANIPENPEPSAEAWAGMVALHEEVAELLKQAKAA